MGCKPPRQRRLSPPKKMQRGSAQLAPLSRHPRASQPAAGTRLVSPPLLHPGEKPHVARMAAAASMRASEAAAIGAASTPNSMTQLRACKTCRLVKSRRQFHKDACENCPGERPHTSGEREDFVQSHTTSAFTG